MISPSPVLVCPIRRSWSCVTISRNRPTRRTDCFPQLRFTPSSLIVQTLRSSSVCRRAPYRWRVCNSPDFTRLSACASVWRPLLPVYPELSWSPWANAQSSVFSRLRLRLSGCSFALCSVAFHSAWFSPLMALEVLHRAFMRLGLFHARKSSQVATLTGLWVLLARVQTILARFQLPDHGIPQSSVIEMIAGRQRVAFSNGL